MSSDNTPLPLSLSNEQQRRGAEKTALFIAQTIARMRSLNETTDDVDAFADKLTDLCATIAIRTSNDLAKMAVTK